jgi:hypothetical protein
MNMQINRHNYETFFLLYVDEELSAVERKTVDVFVQENPDLQIELSLLQQTVVKADDIVLDKKDWLYMEEDITALQENLLLYADDELNGADKKTVEALLAKDKLAQTEWAILQQTKLQPDIEVVFADKQSLYRKEPARVVAFKWWRVAAAAVLLGFGIWTGVSVYNNSNTTTGTEKLANSKKVSPGKIQTDDTTGNTTVTNQPDEKQAAENITSTTANKNNDDQLTENIKSAVEKSTNPNAVSPKENTTVQNNSNKKPDNNLPKPALQNINNNSSNEVTVQNVLPSNNNSSRVSGSNDAVVKLTPKENKTIVENVSNNKTDPKITAIAVVNTNKTADGEDNNRYLNVDDDKQKRTALGGFLRKAKRVLERNTNVKTGEGIKIAGFEIALK